MMEIYPLIKVIHILSSTILFGTGLGSAFYMWMAYRRSDRAVFASVAKSVVLADWVFTTPAVILQPITGLLMLKLAQYSFQMLWIQLSIALYILIGLCWLPVVWIQIRVRDRLESGQYMPNEIDRLMKAWFALGCPAFIGVVIVFCLMVWKPL